MKTKVAQQNFSKKTRDVLKLANDAIKEISAADWNRCVQHDIEQENKYAEVIVKLSKILWVI